MNKKRLRVRNRITERQGYYFQSCFTSCPYCKKTILRIGVYQRHLLIGFIGVNCSYCHKKERADIKKIDYISQKLL